MNDTETAVEVLEPHPGTCDHDAGVRGVRGHMCGAPARWAVAEAVDPDDRWGLDGLIGDVAVAYYCDDHVAGAPIAGRDLVIRNVERRGVRDGGPTWQSLLAAWPAPVKVRDPWASVQVRDYAHCVTCGSSALKYGRYELKDTPRAGAWYRCNDCAAYAALDAAKTAEPRDPREPRDDDELPW